MLKVYKILKQTICLNKSVKLFSVVFFIHYQVLSTRFLLPHASKTSREYCIYLGCTSH